MLSRGLFNEYSPEDGYDRGDRGDIGNDGICLIRVAYSLLPGVTGGAGVAGSSLNPEELEGVWTRGSKLVRTGVL